MPGVGKRVEIGGRSGAAVGNRALTGMGGVGYDAVMSGSNFLSPIPMPEVAITGRIPRLVRV